MSGTHLVKTEDLGSFSNAVLEKMGIPRDDREVVTTALVDAELRGLETHGVVRLTMYIPLIRKGMINPRPQIEIISESPTHALLDNDYGFGFLGGVKAMKLCLPKARQEGIAMGAVRNSTHFGAAGYYARMAAEEGLIGFSTSNSYPVMAPPGTLTPTFGNNPLAYAFPAGDHPPVVIDMATSVASQGRIKQHANQGKPIPPGWAYDREGKPTEDPAAFFLLAPLGEGGYKGFGLALAMDVLGGVLTGSLFAQNFTSGPGSRGCGHFFLAIDPGRLIAPTDYRRRMEEVTGQVKRAQRRNEGEDPLFLPGERGWGKKNRRLREGIPVLGSTLKLLDQLAEELGVPVLRRGEKQSDADERR
jgi:LDH2 family malate/lactate/ureidoglycolate dehydrogenase